jgi:hypothetical protein
MSTINESASDGFEAGEKYLKATYEYGRLKIFHQLVLSLNMLTKIFFIGGLMIIGLIFLSIALAIWLGEIMESLFGGYLIVGGLIIVLGLLVYVFRKRFETVILKKLSKKI